MGTLAMNISSEGFMGVMWVIFTITVSLAAAIQVLEWILGRTHPRP